MERFRRGLRHALALFETDPLSDVRSGPPELETGDGSGVRLEDRSDAALERLLGRHVQQYYHPMGTCRMGQPDDPDAVVKPSCEVIGVRDLYVVDASIMPTAVRAHTNCPTIALAERAADLLRS
jgi:choline dehydrogenase-like flavoprotein